MSSPADSPIINSDDEQSRKKWLSNSPQSSLLHSQNTDSDASTTPKRKSAFQPYRPVGKVLTNLQRGNTEATCYPIEVSLSFHERAGQGELTEEHIENELKRQIENKRDIDFRDEFGFSDLHWAAYYGQTIVAQLLIDVGKAKVDLEAPEKVTPLLLGASGGHHEVVRLLLEYGANVDHLDITGNSPLMYAAAGNHPHTCHELLLKTQNITITNENNDTAYCLAVENGSTLAISVIEQFLLKKLMQ